MMESSRMQINYGPIKRTEPLEAFIVQRAQKILSIGKDRPSRLRIWLKRESGFASKGLPQFVVKLGFKTGGLPEEHFETQGPTLFSSLQRSIRDGFKYFSEKTNRRFHEKSISK